MKVHRYVIGLWLAVLMMPGCATLNPIGPGFIYEPDEDERRLWTSSHEASEHFQTSGALYRDPELQSYVQSVLNRLLGDYRNAYEPLKPRVFILDAESLNAFAIPHGDIYLHTGILGRMRNEAQLAMLLGHELTHNTHRHGYQKQENLYKNTATYSYIAVLSTVGGANIYRAAEGVSRLITLAAINGYGRDKESEADEVGLTLMAQAGYDPQEGAMMFQRMLDATDSKDRGWNFFYSTHPKMKKRVKSCNTLVPRLPPELRANTKEIGQERYVDVAIELIHGEVERHITQGKYELAEETLTFLAEARPSDAATYALRGDLCRARSEGNDQSQAHAAYERALEIDGRNAAAHRGLGLMDVRSGQKAGAIAHLSEYLRLAPDAADASYMRQYLDRLRSEN